MPSDFQVICGSMVGKNRRSPASTETPVLALQQLNKYQKYACCFNQSNCRYFASVPGSLRESPLLKTSFFSCILRFGMSF